MSLKALTSNVVVWKAFSEYLDERIRQSQMVMERSTDHHVLLKEQGKIEVLRHMQKLKAHLDAKGDDDG